MELSHNWRGLQKLFIPKARQNPSVAQKAVAPIYLVTQRGIVISGFAEGEDMAEWLGAPVEEVIQHFRHRDCIPFERDQIDGWVNEASTQPHFLEQMELVRRRALEKSPSRRVKQDLTDLFSREHFLLQAFRGWWNRVLPGEFGFFIRLKDDKGQPVQDFLLILKNGTLLTFLEPELTSMGSERMGQPAEVAKYLSEKYLVPVQGMIASLGDWKRWPQSDDPWREVARGLRQKTVELEPFRGPIAALIISRAYLGL